jgi:hypothetical protein
MPGRSLSAVLQHGEIVRFKTGPNAYDAYYEADALHIDVGGEKKSFKTPSRFAMNFIGYRINGWKDCKVFRDNSWVRLNQLPYASTEQTIKDGQQEVDKMGPKKEAALSVRRKKAQQTIVATIVEPAEPALEVKAIKQIRVQPFELGSKKFWRNYAKEKLFERLPNDGIGAYVGRYNKVSGSIDKEVPDSDEEF